MHRLGVFLLLSIFSLQLFGQSAPNFTITDTEGIEHRLYEDYLDKGKTVLIKLFFVDCPPCNAIAPLVQDLYLEWGEGNFDVQFLELSTMSDDLVSDVAGYKALHSITFPGAGSDGGSLEALQPYVTGTFGPFFGTPKFAVIAPDRSVNFSAGGSGSQSNRITSLDEAIRATGALGNNTPPNVEPSVFDINIENVFQEQESDIKAFISSESNSSLEYEVDISNGSLSIIDLQSEYPGIVDPILKFEKAGSARDRVSPSDMLVLRKHILRILEINDPDISIAADTNRDGTISPADMLVIRKVILGIIQTFPNGNYLFVPNNIPLSLTPGQNQEISVKSIKLGDLNGN